MKHSDKDTMKRFLREVEIMRSLRHPNIVEFMGVCIEQPNICIVTEYLKKGSLHDLLRDRKSKWTWKRYLHISQDIVRGLMWLHRKGIIHRDLKPSNLLVNRHNKVKIADFGLSHVKRSPPSQTGSYGVCGTPCYMAPEVLRQLPYSFKADVFSLGMVLCEMITGEYPLSHLKDLVARKSPDSKNENDVEIPAVDYEHAIIQGIRPEIPIDVPEGIRHLIKQCWNQDPESRPAVEQIMDCLNGIEKEMDKALQHSHDDNLEDLPEEVKKIIHEHQQRMTEMQATLKDCRTQLQDTLLSVRTSQANLSRQRRLREQSETAGIKTQSPDLQLNK
eukprot:TRINITY_DN30155_c0_g1_i1.p1 TRINITY_DN30155_c0_g1~~TRINITY_DN30155_c0_g1_i1.p1  ORF type:complete len:332 (-),score=56.38 TRINITY_DN30155_c0_g1_i1:496-1491(-)